MPSPTFPAVDVHGFYTSGSDRYPCTVVAVSPSGHRVTVEQDDYKVEADPDGHDQHYVFRRREGGQKRVFTRREDGSYRPVGSRYGRLVLGEWDAHQDPHF